MHQNCVAVFLLVLAVWTDIPSVSSEVTPVLQLKNGKIRGLFQEVSHGKRVEFYEGLKYGHAVRFEKAKPADPWTDVYDATSMRAACHQFGNITGADKWMINMTKIFSEDCLYLNVWRPAEHKENRPVMVWIHGGAFEIGTIFTSIFDSRYLAEQDVIVVGVNYRLGPLGFANGGGVLPNLGLHDQILALKWVQENIHSFGGDPKQVTIFGESAGSISVGSLVLSPLAKGLFIRAIMQSGAPTVDFVAEPLNKSLERTRILARKVHCPLDEPKLTQTIECLRKRSVKELQDASVDDFAQNHFFIPVYHDELLPVKPSAALKSGKFNHVDLMYDVNRNEGSSFSPMVIPEVAQPEYNFTLQTAKQGMAKISTFYGLQPKVAQEVAEFYATRELRGNATQDDFRVAISDVWGDFNLVCPSILFGEEYGRHAPSTTHVYSYRLMQVLNFPGTPKWQGVPHGQDQLYLFMPQLLQILSPASYQLAVDMIHAWTSFAKTGVPSKLASGSGSVEWQGAFDRNAGDFATRYMHLESGHYKMVAGHFKPICDAFWKPKIFD